MKIHEYQAKSLLSQHGVSVPRGRVAETKEQVFEIASELGGLVVIKAQIHAGGRGKGGGIQLSRSPEEARKIADSMLGMKLVTHQTGPEGQIVKRVLVEEGLPIKQEFYLSMVIDRNSAQVVVIASKEGGVEIEKLAQEKPELILKEYIEPSLGLCPFQARKLAFALGLPTKLVGQATRFFSSLYQAFESTDASLIEINPLLLNDDNQFYALDAKVTFDDNALYRHPEIKKLRDSDEEEPLEIEASKYKLNYIKLDGNVGCMVNGAGLAMATMDIVKSTGAQPANFLDVGGGASQEKIEAAFTLLLQDSQVKKILVNIFGGILRCDIAAKGIVQACENHQSDIPIVVRLLGTNADEGKSILQGSGLNIRLAETLIEASNLITTSN